MGAPPRSEAGCERVESSSIEEVGGKTVERVAMEDRLAMRRASMADSWTVGIWNSGEKEVGLKRRFCRGGVEAETWERIERRTPIGRNMLMIRNWYERCEKINGIVV